MRTPHKSQRARWGDRSHPAQRVPPLAHSSACNAFNGPGPEARPRPQAHHSPTQARATRSTGPGRRPAASRRPAHRVPPLAHRSACNAFNGPGPEARRQPQASHSPTQARATRSTGPGRRPAPSRRRRPQARAPRSPAPGRRPAPTRRPTTRPHPLAYNAFHRAWAAGPPISPSPPRAPGSRCAHDRRPRAPRTCRARPPTGAAFAGRSRRATGRRGTTTPAARPRQRQPRAG